jgi:large subunit ribosomal protein L10
MKTRAKKQEDLVALTESFKNSKSAMVLSFTGLTVDKDQQFRNELRETGAEYGVVKNTLARLAAKGTSLEDVIDQFKGMTSVAWTSDEPVALSKVIAKYVKENKDVFAFKTGVVEGRVVDFAAVSEIASLPSKEGLIGQLLFLINSPAQRLATVLNAVPSDLAAVVKQVSEREGDLPEAKSEAKAEEEAPKAEAPKEEAPAPEAAETESADAGDAKEEIAADGADESPAEKDSDTNNGGEEPAKKEDSE